MNKLWSNVKSLDVLKAIELFERQRDSYPEPRNTFLIYNNKKYPAKHIRGLAFKVANNKEISKSEYSGGDETSKFFKKLGYTVEYKKDTLEPKHVSNSDIQPVIESKKTPSLNGKRLSVVSQKNALQKLLQRHFGCIEIEKKFDWLKTPDHTNLPNEYKLIAENLLKYRNQSGFLKSNYLLSCDIVLDDQKIIIEYDENQHFTNARQITLENYPLNIELPYSKHVWFLACQKINAKDNYPIDRDERRAYYDTVRDIEAFKNNYTLIRIKHGDVDWEAPNADKFLKEILPIETLENRQTINHKIARLVVTGRQYNKNGIPNYLKLRKIIEDFLSTAYKKQHFKFILTPGGFLSFQFPKNLPNDFNINEGEEKYLPLLLSEAEKTISEFWEGLSIDNFRKLQETADFFTIGIDGRDSNSPKMIELVAIYDLTTKKVIRWTGKSYATNEFQKRILIGIKDLNSHFINLSGESIFVLGCHDLNIFNPRGNAIRNSNSWKGRISDEMKKLCKKYRPTIVLQHPHTTDSPIIWNNAWLQLQKELPTVKHFASGIKYYRNEGVRGDIRKVLEKTKKGDVIDFTFD